MMLKKRIGANSMRTYMAGIQAFFETNDIELRWKKIHRLFPAKVKKTGTRMWTAEDIRIMLSSVRDLRQKALIHFLAASGVRRGAIPELKLKHLQEMPDGCRSVLVYEGSLEEYTTFIHPEAVFWLEKYIEHRRNDGEYIDKNSPLFRKTYQLGIQKAIPLNEDLVMKSVWHAIRVSGLRAGQQKRNGRYETQTDHGFRKRGMTEIPEVVIKRIFEKLDSIDDILHKQCKRISGIGETNKLVQAIWKKILVALGVVSTIISILVVIT
jgi:integrase/recombinase XerD